MTLLFEYFEENHEHFRATGIFWKSGKESIEIDILEELWKGNFEILQTQTDSYSIAAIIKKIFRHMGEPLCTYKYYEEFKCIGDIADEEILINKINTIIEKMP